MSISATVSNHAANLIGQLRGSTIQMLQWAGYSVVRQEGTRGYTTGNLTIPLDQELTWSGVRAIVETQGITVQVVAVA